MTNRYAIVLDSLVENVVLWDGAATWTPPENRTMVLLNSEEACEIGQHFDAGGDPRFTGIPDRGPQSWTSYEFLLRFTESELEIIRGRSFTDATVWRFLTLAEAAHEIKSDDPTTIAGMDYLVSASILTQARRDEILAV
jgi:hypothetical protein